MTREWPLVGRSEELEVITRAARAAGDHARGIVLSGVAGVGKTRLAREAIATCGPRNARRYWIAATASARRVPLGAFADTTTSFGPDPLRRVREAIDGILGERNRPVILGVDDAHHLDDLSAFAVHQLVTRRLATVIVTIRSGEHPPDAITAILNHRHLERLELQPLSLAETTQLVEHILSGPVHSLSAQRLWRYTQGNLLYLHHLIANELDAGRVTRRAGVWLWHGQPTLPPTLAELLEDRIAQAPRRVRGIVDALAVAEPLDTDVLADVTDTDTDAVAEAVTLGLVRVDARTASGPVHLAHPMLGEVHRSGSLRRRRLRGRIATELARKDEADPRKLVQRAILTVDSDLERDPALLTSAASAAMQLHDVRLAETLAEQAVDAGGGLEAKVTHATAITWQERGTDAETVLADVADQTSGPLRAQIAIPRVMNFAVILGQVDRAERELAEVLSAGNDVEDTIGDALRALIDLIRGHAQAAVDRAASFLEDPPSNPVAQMLSIWVSVSGLGDLGRIDEIEAVAQRGYRLVEQAAEVSHLRFPLVFLQANGYRLAGALPALDATISRIQRDTIDVPFEQSFHTFLASMSATNHGALAEAQRLLRECLAYLGTGGSGRNLKTIGRLWLATAWGMTGSVANARREFATIERWSDDPEAREWDAEHSLTRAWVCAAEGAVSQAISILRDATNQEQRLGRPAWEALLLQAATQFGDHTTAARLAELANIVQGPRASAAASHAAALAAESGDGLVDASRHYEEFGDRVAAADAAAQAVVAYRNSGLRGAALTASATARRLADGCQGADTPALRAATMPLPITARQREIIALAAQGLSNKQIGERLTMSVRSVQGHLFRASQRVGVNGRDELIAMLRGT